MSRITAARLHQLRNQTPIDRLIEQQTAGLFSFTRQRPLPLLPPPSLHAL